MLFARQIWALAQKDVMIFRRRWISTLLRALILPIIYTFVLAYIRNWTATPGLHGIGTASPVMDFADALAQASNTRPRVVIIDNGFTTGDIATVVNQLSSTIRTAGKELHVLHDDSQLSALCPSSNTGVTPCIGAVQFWGSPDHGASKQWNYTMYYDSAIGGQVDVRRSNNDIQVYIIPFQHAIDAAIAATQPDGPSLPSSIMQYPYSPESEAQVQAQDLREYEELVLFVLAFAFFIGLSGIIYHCVGHIVQQRERGMLPLMDAMMPNRHKWHCAAIRAFATHLAFDATYFPSWVAMGGLLTIAFPRTYVGYLVALNILAGLALTSYSLLVSSLFRKAQLSAIFGMILAIVFSLVAVYAEGANMYATQGGWLATSLLFPPSTYTYFLIVTAGYEIGGAGLNISQVVPTSGYVSTSVPASTLLGFFCFQIVLFPILAVILETVIHGTDSSSRKVLKSDAMPGTAVRIENFSKDFKSRTKKGATVQAVDNLSADIYTGSVTVLLGANGSGKTTTLSSIAGLQKITKGTIEIDGTGGLGICPQKNIIWDELTVKEHVDLFELLKATTWKPRAERRQESDRLIEGCDLTIKRNARAKTLSGGQKRKLQLAMMLAGGSRVCCIDEATSGIDPLARRKIWDILLAERGKRSLLLTTHFLDEAEVLSDEVMVLSKGVLKAHGSVASLKTQLGSGFKVLLGDNSKNLDIPNLPHVTRKSDYNRAVFEAPDSAVLASLIAALDRSGVPGARDYTIHGPTVEEIFLELSEEMQGDSESARDLTVLNNTDEDDQSLSSQQREAPQDFSLNTGRGCGPIRQTAIMFGKRFTILKHNYMPYVAALFVPLALAGLITRLFIGFDYPNGIPCSNPEQVIYDPYTYRLYPNDLTYNDFVYGPANRTPLSLLQRIVPNTTDPDGYYDPVSESEWKSIPTVNSSLTDFNTYVAANSQSLSFGGFYDDPSTPTFVWQAGYGTSNTVLLQSIVDGVLLNQTLNVGVQVFQRSFDPSGGPTGVVAVFMVLGFAIYPGFFALYPTAERLRNVRAMQYSNGILSSSLWMAYSLFDLIFIVLVSVLTVVIWSTQWHGWYGLGYMFVVFLLYGLTATAFSYMVSLFVSSQLSAFAFSAIIQVIIVMLYFTGYVITAAQAPPDQIYLWYDYIHYTIALISPAASLLRALFMVLNGYSLICRGNQPASYPGEFSIYGAPILYLIIQFILLATFLIYWESGRSLEVFGIRRNRPVKASAIDAEKAANKSSVSSDASEDAAHLASSNDGLRIEHVSKSFGSTRAVDDVTFGILPSEKFALLGPNGAGKSTTISLIRGDLKPDRVTKASIYIGNDSLQHSPVAAKNHLGVCPQFDATDSMTLREHLSFYARARGVPDPNTNINELIKRLGLAPHANKMAKKLSGGTHRKLSLAIALLANPRVLLLDEPSSGMDPAAKRALWRILRQTAAGRVLLLTTHSMEEAAALCDRAGILAGQLLALGSIDQLRRRHGPAACVHIVHRDAPHASAQDLKRMNDWVSNNYPNAEMETRAFGGQIRFNIPRERGDMSDGLIGGLFQKIESAREELGIVDYSIGPATLDQVFMDVITAHNVREENTDEAPRRKWLPW